MKVAIIGGGAAGFFAAISAAEHHPKASVVILEKTSKLLAKVKISGGGRCNVTNGTQSIKNLCLAYPRGGRELKKPFSIFNTKHSFEWFEARGVPLMIQDDHCVFPVSQDSQSIIDCFLSQCQKLGIEVRTRVAVDAIKPIADRRLSLVTSTGNLDFDKVIIGTGGSSKRRGLEWLEDMGHQIVDPVPSLFTFNMPTEDIRSLMGVVVEKTLTSIQGTSLKSDGPLLITHWGMSGPAILKLSAFGARILADCNYQFKVQVNWVNESNNEEVARALHEIIGDHAMKILANYRPFDLPERLWLYLVDKAKLPRTKRWGDLGKKGVNKFTTVLTNDVYSVSGKTTFKEEFVTAGGVSLDSINMKTMESKVIRNLYFAGEVMDIDAITGGYNFQGAWTTGFIAGKLE